MEITNIRVGAATLVIENDKLLLGIRDKEPNRGMLIIPGGKVELFETIEQAAKREVLEETGLEIDLIRQVGTFEIIDKPREHRVIIYWEAQFKSGSISNCSDLKNSKFYTRDEIAAENEKGNITPIVEKVLRHTGWL